MEDTPAEKKWDPEFGTLQRELFEVIQTGCKAAIDRLKANQGEKALASMQTAAWAIDRVVSVDTHLLNCELATQPASRIQPVGLQPVQRPPQ